MNKVNTAKREHDEQGGMTALAYELQLLSEEAGQYDADDIDDNGGPCIDVRVRYYDGNWSLLSGSPNYDQDHRGHWGAGSVGVKKSFVTCMGIAEELVEQVLESIACEWYSA